MNLHDPIFAWLREGTLPEEYLRRAQDFFSLEYISIHIRDAQCTELYTRMQALFIVGTKDSRTAPGYYLNTSDGWGAVIGADSALIRHLLAGAAHDWKHLDALVIQDTSFTAFDIPNLPQLRLLDLSHNPKLRSVYGIHGMVHLEVLNLSNTSFPVIPEEIRQFEHLQLLDLQDLHLKYLPDWLPVLGLPFSADPQGLGICLHGTTVPGVDMSIFGRSQRVISAWFAARQSQSNPSVRDIKVVVLGDDPDVLSQFRLQSAGTQSTGGFMRVHSSVAPDVWENTYDQYGQNIRAHFWSFSRPEYFRAIHPVLFSGQVFYILILDPLIPHRTTLWMREISALSGNAPALLLFYGNSLDSGFDSYNAQLREEFSNITNIYSIPSSRFRVQEITSMVIQPLMETVLKTQPLIDNTPRSWQNLKQSLTECGKRYVGEEDYLLLCQAAGIEDNPSLRENLLYLFQDLGICTCLSNGSYIEGVFLDPQWLTNALHTLLFPSESSDAVLSQSLVEKELYSWGDDLFESDENRSHRSDDVAALIRLMRSHGLCYRFGYHQYFFPLRCSLEMPDGLEEFTTESENAGDAHALRLQINGFSDADLYSLFHTLRRDLTKIWSGGAIFRQKQTGQSACIRRDGDMLDIRVKGNRPDFPAIMYLKVITDTVRRLAPADQPVIPHGDSRNNLAELAQAAAEQAAPQEYDSSRVEIRVLFLGDGEAGKSQTIQRLLQCSDEQTNDPDFTGDATPGVSISRGTYTLPGGKKVLIHFWDFGGQEILHSMHRIFLTRQTLCVIMLNARSDTQDERARYWLRFLRSASSEVPALLVLNKTDQNPNASINENELKHLFSGITEVVKISALKDSRENIEKNLLTQLLRKIGDMDVVKKCDTFPPSWKKVKNDLENMTDAYLLREKYLELCQKNGVDSQSPIPRDLLEFFNELGVSYCEDNHSITGEYVILRPAWVTNAIYAILWNMHSNVRNGIVAKKDVLDLLQNLTQYSCIDSRERYSGIDIQYIIEAMSSSMLCYPIPRSQQRAESLFIPMLCQRNASPIAWEYAEGQDVIQFWMRFNYLPDSLLFMLMVDRYHELDPEAIWFSGARFLEQGSDRTPTGCSAIVKRDENTLKLYIRSENPDRDPYIYRDILKANIETLISQNLQSLGSPNCLVVLKNGSTFETFDLTQLQMSHARKMLHCVSKLRKDFVRITDVMNQTPPQEEEAEQHLLKHLIQACKSLQNYDPSVQNIACGQTSGKDAKKRGSDSTAGKKETNKKFTDEDTRNKFIQELMGKSIIQGNQLMVMDQSQGGLSTSGIKIGERDLLFCIDPNCPWAIFEALNITGNSAKDVENWKSHFDKLIGNYNPYGLRLLFLVTYCNGSSRNFPTVWNGYWKIIQKYNPADYNLVTTSCTQDLLTGIDKTTRIFVARCNYYCSENDDPSVPTTKVYHIFIHLGNSSK